jgi:ABC-type sugar transport system ATPase subunit
MSISEMAERRSEEPALRIEAVSKDFGRNRVLEDVNLTVESGTVHGLVGANGAGKSTMLGILSGRIAPSAGRVLVEGKALPEGNPRASRDAGIAAVYQELTVIPTISACANVFLGAEWSTR